MTTHHTSSPPATASPFRPAWWLRGAHAQTLFAALCRRHPPLAMRQERWELADGDFLDLRFAGDDQASDRPTVLLLHGLQGSHKSAYIQGMMRAIVARGWRAVLIHFRGCGGELNRLPISYHSGHTEDLAHVIAEFQERQPHAPLAAVGYSLGGNVLLKRLAESGRDVGLKAAVAVSVPYDLGCAAERIERGFSRLYQWHLLRSLRHMVREKLQVTPGALPLTEADINALRTFRLFDDQVTAPMHGFAGVEDYYTRCSSGPMLSRIQTPTLLIHARNDPFMTPAAVPDATALPDHVQLELSRDGGHVGFVAGRYPWAPTYYLERRIPDYLAAFLPEQPARASE
ncbi:MAG: hydrolase [Phycisphaeraceae bacterium]